MKIITIIAFWITSAVGLATDEIYYYFVATWMLIFATYYGLEDKIKKMND